MAMRSTLAFQGGSTMLAFDDHNAFNSLYRSSVLSAVAETAPKLALYTNNLCARAPPKLLFRTGDDRTEMVKSARGV